MQYLIRNFQRILVGAACVLAVASAQAQSQTKPAPSPEQDDVIRVNTELVQTDVMVFDKSGQFVNGLKAEQFALKVDDKPQTISFLDQVNSGKASAERNSSGNTVTDAGN